MPLTRSVDINHAEEAKYRLSELSELITKKNQDVSTGQRIHVASEDPQAISRALPHKTEANRIEQLEKNATRAQTVAQFTTKSLDELDQVLLRVQEIASLTNNSLNISNHPQYAINVNQLLEEAVGVSNSTFLGWGYKH